MKSILVATADSGHMTSLTGFLQKNGFFVIPAGDAELALAFLRHRTRIDAIVVDYQIKNFSGLMRAVRDYHPAPPPVIAMSAPAAVADYLAALGSGVLEFLFRPICTAEFLRVLTAALESKSRPPAGGRLSGTTVHEKLQAGVNSVL